MKVLQMTKSTGDCVPLAWAPFPYSPLIGSGLGQSWSVTASSWPKLVGLGMLRIGGQPGCLPSTTEIISPDQLYSGLYLSWRRLCRIDEPASGDHIPLLAVDDLMAEQRSEVRMVE
jgi:hypothetical protein